MTFLIFQGNQANDFAIFEMMFPNEFSNNSIAKCHLYLMLKGIF